MHLHLYFYKPKNFGQKTIKLFVLIATSIIVRQQAKCVTEMGRFLVLWFQDQT